jgi:hydroxymethylpyrimidine pyrophosphatase-like HAD family hydrolase
MNGNVVHVKSKERDFNYYRIGLQDGCLVMLIGRSGCGKTTFAIQTASNIIRNFSNGVIYHDDIEGGLTPYRKELLSGFHGDELKERYGDHFSITLSGKTILEIQPLGVSKKIQLPYLKALYPHTELWCIGDFHNDAEMLSGADVAVCPANAVDEIKRICQLQVCHCKEGALADMIDEIERRIDAQNETHK